MESYVICRSIRVRQIKSVDERRQLEQLRADQCTPLYESSVVSREYVVFLLTARCWPSLDPPPVCVVDA